MVYLTDAGEVAFGHHVMATADVTGLALCLAGVPVASLATTLNLLYLGYLRLAYDNLAGWRADWPSAPSTNFLAGTLDKAAVYGRTPTAADAADHSAAGA